jgi:hypothetical protein
MRGLFLLAQAMRRSGIQGARQSIGGSAALMACQVAVQAQK